MVRRSVPLLSLLLVVVPGLVTAQRSPGIRTVSVLTPPMNLTAGWTRVGVQLLWSPGAGASQYLVFRGPDPNALSQVATVAAPDTGYVDLGGPGPVSYQVVAVDPYGRQAAGVPVAYAPPATFATKSLRSTDVATRYSSQLAPPAITAVLNAATGTDYSVRNGEEVLVKGTGLAGLSSVVAQVGWAAYGKWTAASNNPPVPVTPIKVSSTSFSFVAQLPASPNLSQLENYLIIVTTLTGVDTSDTPIPVGNPLPVRKIVSLAQTVVKSGERFKISGVGLDQVIGGYIGAGTPGSVQNPLLSPWNRSATYVELATPTTCDGEGTIMLEQPQIGIESKYITPPTPIAVACVPANPSGTLVGPANGPNGVVFALPGSQVGIQGKYLKHVTRVIDQNGVAHPFTVSPGINFDAISVTLPASPTGAVFGLYLENQLSTPTVATPVPGAVQLIGPPQFSKFDPAWAEPGQLVHIYGHQLKWNSQPQVTVGGIPAQIVSATSLDVAFTVPPNATTGPVEIQNEGGRIQLTGQFPVGVSQVQHPGFFLVVGPSVVTEIIKPANLAIGDMITVRGENLARVGGICVPGTAGQGYLFLRRPEITSSGTMGWLTSNTEMQVKMEWSPVSTAAGPIQLYANTQPVGIFPPVQFACAPNPQLLNWP